MHRLLIVGLLAAVMAAGCGGDNSPLSSSGTGSASSGDSSTTSAALAISGSPANSVVVGQRYSFQPAASDSSSGALTFSIQNAPDWTTFNSATGQLSGTPTAAEVGTYANIIISVSDGTSETALPAFSVAVTETASGTATLSWTAPSENTNGTALTNLAGYWINYGTSADNLSEKVKVDNPGIVTYVVSNLSAGTWYFSITAYSAANVQSAPSSVASYTVD
jgi:putative Ig domain-containing protein